MLPLFGLKAISVGAAPTRIVAITVFVELSITETVLLLVFATYILPLFGLKAIPTGAGPTRMVAITTPRGGLLFCYFVCNRERWS
jgi:hypothetical protein